MSADGKAGIVRHRIVIVGAGVAGLAAARELDRFGVFDYVVVEAQSRIGGRVHTIFHDGSPLELGAQFIHGNEGNPVHSLAADSELIVNEPWVHAYDCSAASSFRTIGGQCLSEQACEEVASVVDRIQDLASQLHSTSGQQLQLLKPSRGVAVGGCVVGSDDSMGSFWRREYETYLNSASCQSDDEVTLQLKVAMHDWHERYQAVDNACDGLDGLSLQLWGLYAVRGDDYELSRGYDRVVELLAAPATARQRIWLSSPVVRVDWSVAAAAAAASALAETADCSQRSVLRNGSGADDGGGSRGVDKTTANDGAAKAPLQGSADGRIASESSASRGGIEEAAVAVLLTDGRTILAEHVIITVSLGCLKRSASTFFAPSLSATKLSAIEKIQFGTTNKIYLAFDAPFWSGDSFLLNFVWLDGDVDSFRHRLSGYLRNQFGGSGSGSDLLAAPDAEGEEEGNPWWKHVVHFHSVRHHPSLLEGWIAGAAAERMEMVDDEAVLVTCWQLLASFHGPGVPKPKLVLRTRWHNTDYVYGSYSSIPPGLKEEDIRAYAEPIRVGKVPRLLFAGEGTHVNDYSTVHGAFTSGVDAAKTLLDYMQPSLTDSADGQTCLK